MKKFILILFLGVSTTTTFAALEPRVSQEVLASFEKTFANAQEVSWVANESFYMVSFKLDGIRSSIRYAHDGSIETTIRYYEPAILPFSIQHKLSKKFPARTLYGVTEIGINEGVFYYVKMQDEKCWYTVKLDSNGNMVQTEKFTKL